MKKFLPLLPFPLLLLVLAGAFGIDPSSVRPVAAVGGVVSACAALACLPVGLRPDALRDGRGLGRHMK